MALTIAGTGGGLAGFTASSKRNVPFKVRGETAAASPSHQQCCIVDVQSLNFSGIEAKVSDHLWVEFAVGRRAVLLPNAQLLLGFLGEGQHDRRAEPVLRQGDKGGRGREDQIF